MAKLAHFIFTVVVAISAGTMASQTPTANYLIIGAGTSGLVLANRLSSDPKTTVILIEPGPDDRSNPNVTIPLNWLQNLDTSIDWAYTSAHQTGACNRSLKYHAGKLVGGTSMINGMMYVRADAAEIDAWQALGATGWNWDTLWPYYKRLEHFIPPTAAQVKAGARYIPEFHGRDGDLTVSYPFELLNGSFYEIIAATWEGIGFSKTLDSNGGDVGGFAVQPLTVDREANARESAATAFYYPIDGRPNLRVIKGTAVRVLWGEPYGDQQVANGVEYLDENEKSHMIRVDTPGEVILSAGALRTPPILEASGIGNPARLSDLSIELKVDLPGVGENLQDQPNMMLAYDGRINSSGYTPYTTFATALQIYGDENASIAASVDANISDWSQKVISDGSGVSADAIEQIFRIQYDLIFNKNVTIAEILTVGSANKLGSVFWALLPFSRGSVHLRSRKLNDTNNPVIDPRFFQVGFDLRAQTAIGQLAQRFWTKEPAKSLVRGSFALSGQDLPSDADETQWASFIKRTFTPNNHPVGTAAMMARELGGVVNSELKVYGTSNVRVVDAAVIPLQVSGHLTSTLYAIASRAADMILGSCWNAGMLRLQYNDQT